LIAVAASGASARPNVSLLTGRSIRISAVEVDARNYMSRALLTAAVIQATCGGMGLYQFSIIVEQLEPGPPKLLFLGAALVEVVGGVAVLVLLGWLARYWPRLAGTVGMFAFLLLNWGGFFRQLQDPIRANSLENIVKMVLVVILGYAVYLNWKVRRIAS
jgi:hypothetical protein